PSVKRQQALFDWWERIFDYTWLRRQVKPEPPVWLLFDDAATSPTEDPRQLVRHLGINATVAPIVLAYAENAASHAVTAPDLQDERGSTGVGRADGWLRGRVDGFSFRAGREPPRALGARIAPGGGGGTATLTKLVEAAYIERGPPRRYEDLKR